MPVSGAVSRFQYTRTVSEPLVWVALRVNPGGAVTGGGGPPHVATVATTTSPVVAPAGTGTVAAVDQESFPVDELERYVGVPPGGSSATVMVTVSRAVNSPSPTVRSNVSDAAVFGAVKVGLATVELERLTDGPAVWVHWWVRVSPLGSRLPDPSKVTLDPSATVWSGPAAATGGWLPAGTMTSRTVFTTVPDAARGPSQVRNSSISSSMGE